MTLTASELAQMKANNALLGAIFGDLPGLLAPVAPAKSAADREFEAWAEQVDAAAGPDGFTETRHALPGDTCCDNEFRGRQAHVSEEGW